MIKTLIINGPNLNLLHLRNKQHYGNTSLNEIFQQCFDLAKTLKIELDFFQSNHEGEIVEQIQTAINNKTDAIIINPAAYTHTSIAIADALEIFTGYKIEVHLSNIGRREKFRQHSFISAVVDGTIAGMQQYSYLTALNAVFYHFTNKIKCD